MWAETETTDQSTARHAIYVFSSIQDRVINSMTEQYFAAKFLFNDGRRICRSINNIYATETSNFTKSLTAWISSNSRMIVSNGET